jgi:hypothetical protein
MVYLTKEYNSVGGADSCENCIAFVQHSYWLIAARYEAPTSWAAARKTTLYLY